ncbi:MAG TPA: hypothetical protein VFF45_00700 [Bacilli bacterium]|jgi:hypothetical protein|nr:hypothetical protein [Bacilli bacterium]
MVGPVVVQGLKPSNVLELKEEPSTAVLLVMRRPPMVRSRETRIRWSVACQVVIESRNGGSGDGALVVSVPPSPSRRSGYFVGDELLLPPLPAAARPVLVVYFPLPAAMWRFEFSADVPEDPDAKAEAWAFAFQTPHVNCGMFKVPYRAGVR